MAPSTATSSSSAAAIRQSTPGIRTAGRRWTSGPAQIAARGVKVINGHLIGDDNAFAEPGWGSGWSWDDLVADYGSPIGALQYHENEVELLIGPGMEPGTPAIVSSAPLGHGLLVDNQVMTAAADEPARVSVDRVPGQILLTVRGQVAAGAAPHPQGRRGREPHHAFRQRVPGGARRARASSSGALPSTSTNCGSVLT